MTIISLLFYFLIKKKIVSKTKKNGIKHFRRATNNNLRMRIVRNNKQRKEIGVEKWISTNPPLVPANAYDKLSGFQILPQERNTDNDKQSWKW